MRTRLPLAILLGLIVCSADNVYAQRGRALLAKVTITRDVEYRKAGDLPLHVDLYQPNKPASDKLPVVVWIHGGGWQNGNKSGAGGRLLPLVASGKYAGVAVQYRLSGVAPWPAQIHDCKAAIRWVRAHAEKYHWDPERIAVWGSSAGGHLVSMLGTSGDVEELEGDGPHLDQSSRVTCVVDFCGPSDFTLYAENERFAQSTDSSVAKLLGGSLNERIEVARQASPATHVSDDDPPFLIFHGTEDPTVSIAQAEHLFDKLTKAKVDVHFVKIIGGNHGIGGPVVGQRVSDFLSLHLLGEKVEVTNEPITLK